jgi:hypothetical protein
MSRKLHSLDHLPPRLIAAFILLYNLTHWVAVLG